MPCYHLIEAFRKIEANPSGKHSLNFGWNPSTCVPNTQIFVPCGNCIGCRLDYSRRWAVRCMHEAQMHEHNSFITLTYAPEFLPEDNSIHVEDVKAFFKRLRRRVEPLTIRNFYCGEYGSQFHRPHYHAIVFGFDFPDRQLFSVRNGFRCYTSSLLQSVWPFGFSMVADVSFETCAYVARYVTKKIKGDIAEEHYQGREVEFAHGSRRPGIGRSWIEKYFSDVYPADRVIVRNGVEMLPPKYYDDYLESVNPDLYEEVKQKRQIAFRAMQEKGETHWRRQDVKEQIKLKQFEKLIRPYENLTV